MSPQVVYPTQLFRKKLYQKLGDISSSDYVKFSAKIDDRGRIFIPADIRKTLALNTGDFLDLMLSASKRSFEVRKNGCGGVTASIQACGAFGPGSSPGRGPWRKIGILGGMGPEATARLYQRIIEYCQRKYNVKYDSAYPEIFIYNLPIPDVVEGFKNKEEILGYLINGVKQLQLIGSEFIVIPCNTVDYFITELRKRSSIPILSIVEEAINQIKDKKYKKIGLLSTEITIKNRLYEQYLKNSGIDLIVSDENEQKIITSIILNILNGKKLQEDKEKIKLIINRLKSKGSEAVILGCTDLPLLIEQEDVSIPLFDTLQILAENTVKRAKRGC